MPVHVERVSAEITQPLRLAVLRPHQEPADRQRADAAAAGTTHVAALGARVVGAPWNDPDTRPHVQMTRPVSPAPR